MSKLLDSFTHNFHPHCNYATQRDMHLVKSEHDLNVFKGNKVIRFSLKHLHYSIDIIRDFDHYFSSVESVKIEDCDMVDFSTLKSHMVIGYPRHPVFFTSLAEPVSVTKQYLDFANLQEGQVVLDLGAYSGLTSILFKDGVGSTGTVVAVEADIKSIDAMNENFRMYKDITENDIEIVYGAAWNNCDGLKFASEGNMGSGVSARISADRGGDVIEVASYTLSEIARVKNLSRVDFIKCDIEGAESVVFEDAAFFEKFQPRIIVETHIGVDKNKIINDLGKFDYQYKVIEQIGHDLPLIEFIPK